jgi:hypothetical protein
MPLQLIGRFTQAKNQICHAFSLTDQYNTLLALYIWLKVNGALREYTLFDTVKDI